MRPFLPGSILAAGLAGLVGLAAARPATAQGTVAAQGLGYPTGGLSTRALGAAGSFADFDAISAVNPGALAQSGTLELFVQTQVERRATSVGGASGTAVIPTFPLAGAIIPVGRRWATGITISSFLDRTWGSVRDTTITLDGQDVLVRDRLRSEGGITDIRLGLARRFGSRAFVGVGAHLFTGDNLLTISRSFPEEQDFGAFLQQREIDYTGGGVSAGVVVQPVSRLSLALSGLVGTTLDASQNDSLLASGTIPSRVSVGARYQLPGAMFAARAGWTGYTDLAGLADRGGAAPSVLDPRDTWEYAVGADVEGPTVFGQQLVVRAGLWRRDLPFRVRDQDVRETQLTGGFGLPIARGRALFDVAVARASRSGVQGADETAWTTSVGLVVRP